MRRLGFSRTVTLLLTAGAALTLLICLGLAAFLVYQAPLLNAAPVVGTPVAWTALPSPLVTRPQWTSYTYSGHVNDLVLRDRLLWVATDGGLVAVDTASGSSTKFVVEHGLPANRVSSVAAGLDGTIWVGTSYGVGHYDGRQWRRFTEADGLTANGISDLLVDHDGVVWAATASGLNRYDSRGWRTFTTETLLPASFLSPMPSNNIRALALAANNDLWLATDRGGARFDGREWQQVSTGAGLLSEDVRALASAPGDGVWIGSAIGVNRLLGQAVDDYPLPQAEGRPVHVLQPAGDGSLLVGFGDAGGGLLRLDPQTQAVDVLDLPGNTAVRAIWPGTGNTLWLGTGSGLLYFDGRSWTDVALPSELPSATVNGLLETQDAVWAATGDGVIRYDGTWHAFDRRHGLAEADVRALAAGPDGRLWAAYANPLLGLSYLEGSGPWQSARCALSGPPSATVKAISRAPDGTLWFGTANGVSRFDGTGWRHFSGADGLPVAEVQALAVGDDGRLWVGTDAGLFLGDEAGWTMVAPDPVGHIALGQNDTPWLVSNGQLAQLNDQRLASELLQPVEQPPTLLIRTITATGDTAWAATPDGVARFDGENWSFYTTDQGLPSNDITAVTAAPDGTVWAAASVGGEEVDFVYFDAAANRFRSHPRSNPPNAVLTSNMVNDAQVTPDGAVWLATANGVSRFAGGRWENWDGERLAAGPDVRALAYAQGRVWFATSTGLVAFDGSEWLYFTGGSHMSEPGGIAALAVDAQERLWVVPDNFSEGMRVFDDRGWELISTMPGESRLDALAFDDQGRLWVAGERLDQPGLFFGHYVDGGWLWQLPGTLDYPISAMTVDEEGQLWIAAATGQGLEVRDISGDDLGETVATFQSPTPSPIESLLVTRDGTLWAGSGANLLAYDGTSWRELSLPVPFSRHVFALTETNTGAIWAATEEGVAVYDGETWDSYYAPLRTPPWWGSVRAMQVRPDGGILFGTANGGIGLFTGRSFKSDRPTAWRGQAITINDILSEGEDSLNLNLWIATEGFGLARLDGIRWSILAPDAALTAPVTGLGLTPDGTAWLGTAQGIVGVRGLEQPTCSFVDMQNDVQVSAVATAADGAVWFGTAATGAIERRGLANPPETTWEGAEITALATAPDGDMWFVNPHQDWLSYTTSTGDGEMTRRALNQEVLAAEDITAIGIAPDLTAWLGTTDGVVSFNGLQWQRLTPAAGLADARVEQLLVARDGSLWIATPGGLSHYVP